MGLTVPTPQGRSVQVAEVYITGADIVYKADGNTPTSSDGSRFPAGARFEIEGASDLANFKAIRQASTDATLWIEYSYEEN